MERNRARIHLLDAGSGHGGCRVLIHRLRRGSYSSTHRDSDAQRHSGTYRHPRANTYPHC